MGPVGKYEQRSVPVCLATHFENPGGVQQGTFKVHRQKSFGHDGSGELRTTQSVGQGTDGVSSFANQMINAGHILFYKMRQQSTSSFGISYRKHLETLKPFDYKKEQMGTEQSVLRRKLSRIRQQHGQYSRERLLSKDHSLPEIDPKKHCLDSVRLGDRYYYIRINYDSQQITVEDDSRHRVMSVPVSRDALREFLHNKKKWLRKQLNLGSEPK